MKAKELSDIIDNFEFLTQNALLLLEKAELKKSERLARTSHKMYDLIELLLCESRLKNANSDLYNRYLLQVIFGRETAYGLITYHVNFGATERIVQIDTEKKWKEITTTIDHYNDRLEEEINKLAREVSYAKRFDLMLRAINYVRSEYHKPKT